MKSAWIVAPKSVKETHWGSIASWSGIQSTTVKLIKMKKGTRTSFKYNKLKDEILICGNGKLRAVYADQEILSGAGSCIKSDTLTDGSALVVQSECPYRLEALEDSLVIEVSSGQEGCVRFADDYGRDTQPGNKYIQEVIEKYWG